MHLWLVSVIFALSSVSYASGEDGEIHRILTAPLASDVLGIDPQASFREIKSAYRRLSKKFHPDHNQDRQEVAEKIMTRLNQARDLMEKGDGFIDPPHRNKFHASSSSSHGNSSRSRIDINHFAEQFFSQRQPPSWQNGDITLAGRAIDHAIDIGLLPKEGPGFLRICWENYLAYDYLQSQPEFQHSVRIFQESSSNRVNAIVSLYDILSNYTQQIQNENQEQAAMDVMNLFVSLNTSILDQELSAEHVALLLADLTVRLKAALAVETLEDLRILRAMNKQIKVRELTFSAGAFSGYSGTANQYAVNVQSIYQLFVTKPSSRPTLEMMSLSGLRWNVVDNIDPEKLKNPYATAAFYNLNAILNGRRLINEINFDLITTEADFRKVLEISRFYNLNLNYMVNNISKYLSEKTKESDDEAVPAEAPAPSNQKPEEFKPTAKKSLYRKCADWLIPKGHG